MGLWPVGGRGRPHSATLKYQHSPGKEYVMKSCRWMGVMLGALVPVVAALAVDDPPDRRRTPVVDVVEQCRDAVVNISTTRVVRMRSLYGSPLDSIFDFGPP